MATVNAVTDLATFLAVYAFKSIPTYAADIPPRNLFSLNMDESVGTVGQQVVTRVPISIFATTANNLANGWGNLAPTSSNVTTTLQAKGYDHLFNVVSWDTIGESQLVNTFAGILQKQTANAIFVDAANLVTSSNYTNTVTVGSSSLFSLTGSSGLQGIGTTMDNLELPQVDRYALLNPTAYQGLISNIYQTYVLGNDRAVVGNGFAGDSDKNQAWPGLDIAGFDVFKSPRINTNTALTPYGGAKYSSGNVLAGWAGVPSGLVLAARSFELAPSPLMATIPVIEPTSGFPLTYMLSFDPSLPGWRIGVYSLYGVSVANANAIVPILSATT